MELSEHIEQKRLTRWFAAGFILVMAVAFAYRLPRLEERTFHGDEAVQAFKAGEELYERGRYGHGYSMYDEVLRVPMVFTGPGITQGTVEMPVSGIDLMPTFADLLHVGQRTEWRGRSLLPLLRGETLEEAPVYAQGTHHFRYHPEPLQAVIEGP